MTNGTFIKRTQKVGNCKTNPYFRSQKSEKAKCINFSESHRIIEGANWIFEARGDRYLPRERIVNEIHIPLYLKPYISLAVGSDKILEPYATSSLLTSLKRSMPFGDEVSKVKR